MVQFTLFNESLGEIRAVKHYVPPLVKRAAGRLITWLLAAYSVLPTSMIMAEATDPVDPPRPVITDPAVLVTLPSRDKERAQPLRIEGLISYFDPGYRMVWIDTGKIATYLQLSATPPLLRTGQYAVIEGNITLNKGLSAEDVSVRVVEENAPFTPLETKGRINDLTAFHGRMVMAEGFVDSQLMVDPEHIRLMLIVENRPVICWIKPDNPKHVPDWTGNFVRVTGLYSRRFDPSQTNTTIEIWQGPQERLQVLGTLQHNRQFDRPTTPINELFLQPIGAEVRVRGRIESHQVGKALIMRDETGLVEIRSIQEQRLSIGAEVEAIGRIAVTSGQWVLDEALYRPVEMAAVATQSAANAPDATLRTVAQIRGLSTEEAAQNRPVDISGVVVWSLTDSDFFYLQDLTGGIRVHFDPTKIGTVRYEKYFQVKGVTAAGRFAPTVELRDFADLGALSFPTPRLITLEQALTGKEEGQWVELRGFLRDTVSEGNWRWIHVTTRTGEFTGHLQNPVNFVANPGSLIRAHGVCETTTDPGGHITGVTLRITQLQDITIEQDAPADFYDLPLREIRDLDQLSSGPDMKRARIIGDVLAVARDGTLYVQDKSGALRVHSHLTVPLAPGDRVEAVGVLGREGVRTVLRETVYRKTASGPPVAPITFEDLAQLSPANDSRLVRVRGTLIDKFDRPDRTRLTLQAGNVFYEAVLDRPDNAPPPGFALGAGLQLTGIYRLEFDDSRQVRSFQLHLRSPDDVVVIQQPRLWTLQRALLATSLLAGCTLLGLGWITALRRRVSRQTEQIRGQLEHQARLEAEVQRAARLESLGVLAGGIAHDYNNLLTIIMGNLSLMKFAPEVMALEGGRVEDIEEATVRARDLTRQLLTFAEGGEPLRRPVDLAALVRKASELVLQGGNIPCAYEIEEGLPPACIDRDQITQVVQNLVRNAVEAMPGGGKLRILLAHAEIQPNGHAKLKLKPGRYIRMVIIDTGTGIAPDVLPRIFDPYFSTKKIGNGLGLATVYSIIKKHQGQIEAHSTPGQGATFILWLPVAEATMARTQTEHPLLPPPTRAAASASPAPLRALLMDDEESIRKLGSILLEQIGLEVTAVADGAMALREFEAAHKAERPFSLLVLDLTIMGGMGGKDTIELIRKTDPSVPAIVSSGYSRDPVMAQFRAYGFQGVIPKPYDIKSFKETVQSLLPKHTRVG